MKLEDEMSMDFGVLSFLEGRGWLPAAKKIWKNQMEDRLTKLRGSKEYREVHCGRMMAWGGMSAGRPQRRSNMSLAQEHLGWQVTMQSWDHACHLAAHGTAEELKGIVGVPEEFIKQRANIVAVFTDQVPIWLARSARCRRIVFADHEQVSDSKQSTKVRAGRIDQRGTRAPGVGDSLSG